MSPASYLLMLRAAVTAESFHIDRCAAVSIAAGAAVLFAAAVAFAAAFAPPLLLLQESKCSSRSRRNSR